MEGLLTLKKITLYLVDRGRKFVRLWQLLEVLGFVAPVIPHFSVVMRGGDLQDENGPELAFRGAAGRLGTEAGGAISTRKSVGESRAWAWGMPGRGPDRWLVEPASARLQIVSMFPRSLRK